MLDTKDFSWKGLTKVDKITFIATFVCPIVTLLGTAASNSLGLSNSSLAFPSMVVSLGYISCKLLSSQSLFCLSGNTEILSCEN